MYLIRHDRVALQGICYGQSDIDSEVSYRISADAIRPFLNDNIKRIYTSPLKRCSLLAGCLFTNHVIVTDSSLMEVNFGDWEQQAWSSIPRQFIED